MICKNCNQQISDESAFCPYCGTPVEQTVSEPTAAPQPEAQYVPPAQPVQQPVYQQPQPQQYYPNPAAQFESDVDSAKTLGIVALVGAFFLPLISYICGGIGLSKIKKLKPQANEQQTAKLKSAKSLCTAGIIVHTVLVVLSIIITIILSVFVFKAAEEVYDGIKDNPNFNYNYEMPDDIPDEYKQYFDNLK